MLVVMLALTAALAYAIQTVVTKYAVEPHGVAPVAAALLIHIGAGIVAIPVLILWRVPWVPIGYPGIAGAALCALAASVLAAYAVSREDASVAGPMLGVKVLLLAGLLAAFGGEHIGPGLWVGAFISVVGLVFLDQKDHWDIKPHDLLRRGVIAMLFAALFYALYDVAIQGTLRAWGTASNGLSLYLLVLGGVVSGLTLLPVLFHHYHRRRPISPRGLRHAAWPLLIGAVMAFVVRYTLVLSFAAGGGDVTLPNLLYNTRGVFMVLIMSVLVLGHKHTIEQAGWRAYIFRFIGATLTVGATLIPLWWK